MLNKIQSNHNWSKCANYVKYVNNKNGLSAAHLFQFRAKVAEDKTFNKRNFFFLLTLFFFVHTQICMRRTVSFLPGKPNSTV